MSMAAIRGQADMIDLNRKQTRIRHLETDELDQILSYCFRYSPGSTLIHIGTNKLKLVPLGNPLDYRAYQLGPQ